MALPLIGERLPFDFFISYNQESVNAAHFLLDKLESFGLIGWMDQRYYYLQTSSLLSQLFAGLRCSRFIIVIAPEHFRNTRWCQFEYRIGLAAEHSTSIKQVLVVTNKSCCKLPIPLKHCPIFCVDSQQEITKLVYYIKLRRKCFHSKEISIKQARTRIDKISKLISHSKYLLSDSETSQLKEVARVCSWLVDSTSDISDGDAPLILHVFDETPMALQLSKNEFLSYVQSDDSGLALIPFGQLFFGFFNRNRDMRSEQIQEVIDIIHWNQCLVLSKFRNRYFKSEMLGVVESIARDNHACLFDEVAQNHYFFLGGLGWARSVYSNCFIQSGTIKSNIPLATLCEHIALINWQDKHRMKKLVSKFSRQELVSLVVRRFSAFVDRLVGKRSLHKTPKHALLLGLTADLVRQDSISPPSVVIDLIGYSLKEIFDDYLFEFGESRYYYRTHDLIALSGAIKVVINLYMNYLHRYSMAGNVDLVGAQLASCDSLLALLDYTLNPTIYLIHKNINAIAIIENIKTAMIYFNKNGDKAVQSISSFVLNNIDRLTDKSFKEELFFVVAMRRHKIVQ